MFFYYNLRFSSVANATFVFLLHCLYWIINSTCPLSMIFYKQSNGFCHSPQEFHLCIVAGERSWRICFHGSLSAKRIGLLYSVVKEHERRNFPFTSYRERKVPFAKLKMKYFSFHTKTRLQSPVWIQKQDIFLLYIQHSPAKGILLTKTEKFFTFFFFRTI